MASKETIGGVSVYVPTGDPATVAARLAPRLQNVRGARIGILDNCKEFADLVLRGVAEALQREHGVGGQVLAQVLPGHAVAFRAGDGAGM